MNPPNHVLPPAAASALLELVWSPTTEVRLSRYDGLMVDQDWQTVILEPAKGSFTLRLSRDCPFDEIAPAYLVLFVRRLSDLCPGIDIAHRIQCGHPIVASVSLALSEQASEGEWKAAITASLAMLEAALERQSEAAENFRLERGQFLYSEPWPTVDVSDLQLRGVAGFDQSFRSILTDSKKDGQERLLQVLELGRQLEEYLEASGLLQPDRDWTAVLFRDKLEMGFWDNVDFRDLSASQLVVVLNAVIQGGLYSETITRRAYSGPMILALLARAKELAG
jgi:hypothetical protein